MTNLPVPTDQLGEAFESYIEENDTYINRCIRCDKTIGNNLFCWKCGFIFPFELLFGLWKATFSYIFGKDKR